MLCEGVRAFLVRCYQVCQLSQMKAQKAVALYADLFLQLREAHRSIFKGLQDSYSRVMAESLEEFRPGDIKVPFVCGR